MKILILMKGEKMALGQQAFDREFIEIYKETIEKALQIQKKKNETYNGKTVSYKDYASIDNFYFAQMWNKMLRIKSIVGGSKANFESLEDSLIDLINYAAFFAAEINMNKLDE